VAAPAVLRRVVKSAARVGGGSVMMCRGDVSAVGGGSCGR
jgi:hypothetical protein